VNPRTGSFANSEGGRVRLSGKAVGILLKVEHFDPPWRPKSTITQAGAWRSVAIIRQSRCGRVTKEQCGSFKKRPTLPLR